MFQDDLSELLPSINMGSFVKIVFTILKNSICSPLHISSLIFSQNFRILLLSTWRCQAVSFMKAIITGFMCRRPDVFVASV